MRRTNIQDIIDLFSALGVRKGDTIMLHSALYTLGYIEGGLSAFHEAVLRVLGDNGNLLVPTFTYSFRRNETFDIRATKADPAIGAYSEFVRTQSGAKRNACPLFSIAGIGPDAERLIERKSSSCFGINTVYETLFDANILFVGLGIPWSRGLSAFMHLERLANVPYRVELPLYGSSIGWDGCEYDDTAIHYARNEAEFPHDLANRDKMGELLVSHGACQLVSIDNNIHKALRAQSWQEIVLNTLSNNPLFMLEK